MFVHCPYARNCPRTTEQIFMKIDSMEFIRTIKPLKFWLNSINKTDILCECPNAFLHASPAYEWLSMIAHWKQKVFNAFRMQWEEVLFYCKTQCSITASLVTLITHHICCFHLQARSLQTNVINYKAVAQIMEKTCTVLRLKQGRQLRYLHLSIFLSKSSSLLWTENIKDITQWKNQHAYTMCMLLNLFSAFKEYHTSCCHICLVDFFVRVHHKIQELILLHKKYHIPVFPPYLTCQFSN